MPSKHEDDRLLTVEELAEYLSVSRWTVYSWVNKRRVPFVKAVQAVRFRKSAIDLWMSTKRDAKT